MTPGATASFYPNFTVTTADRDLRLSYEGAQERGFLVRTLNAAFVLASIAVAPIVCAAEVGDPQRGQVYAKKVCAKCHAVEAGDVFSRRR